MAYADLAAVKARAGVLAGAWTDTSTPSNTDVDQFLVDVAAEIDAILAGRSLTVPATGTAASALVAVNADGALLTALNASYPETSGLASASETIQTVQTRYDAAMAALMAGTHPAIAALEAGNVGSRATSFWENEPFYGEYPLDPRTYDPFSPDANPHTRPTIERGQSL